MRVSPKQRSRGAVRSAAGLIRTPRASSLIKLGFCLGGVFLCTWISFRSGQDLASTGFLYLVFVVLAAVYSGFWEGTVVSLISVACLDYFFNEPVFSFRVDRLSNWVEMGAFEFTALVVSRLSNDARLRALDALRERRESARLHETARRILLIDNRADTGNRLAALLRNVFELKAVLLFDADPAALHESHRSVLEIDREALARKTRAAYLQDLDEFEPKEKTWCCVLRLGMRPVGALALCGTEMSELSARGIASLAAIALERARAIEKQSHAEAARQVEKLRTAVLDSLAHKFKTPLTVIRTAVAGIPAAGELCELQTDLVTLIDQEAIRLNELAHRLVSAPGPDTPEFKPEQEPLLFSRLITAAIGELDLPGDRKRFHVRFPQEEPPVLADRELILTALSQLIDNALKYSISGSPVDIAFEVKDTAVTLNLRSRGLVVARSEQERIFDRFYRSPAAQNYAAGTGLGLCIVKAIASDHHGHVWARGEPGYGTSFSLSLPRSEQVLP